MRSELAYTVEGLSTEDLARNRRMFENDLYLFSKACFGYHDFTKRVHEPMCRFIESGSPEEEAKIRWKLMLSARGHFKSSVLMADDFHRVIKNQETRILKVSESGENAERMLGEIRDRMYNSELIRILWPGVIPPNPKRDGKGDSLYVPRQGSYREPTIFAAGITSKLTSQHYPHISADDLIAEEGMNSPSTMKKSKEFVNRLRSLLVNARTDTINVTGTHWAFDDTYSHIKERWGELPYFAYYNRKPIVRNPITGEPEPLFPERYTMEDFYSIIKTDPIQWATQYANDPVDTTLADLKPQWLQSFKVGPDRAARFEDIDGTTHRIPMDAMRFYIHVDPAIGLKIENDYTGIVVVGVAPGKQIFIWDEWAERGDVYRIVDKILQLAQTYNANMVSIEDVAAQRYLIQMVQAESRKRGLYLRVEGYRPAGGKNKEQRILANLQALYANGHIWHREACTSIHEEYMHFGRSQDDHLLDALAQGPDYWRAPLHDRAIEKMQRVQALAEANNQRGSTGYGI